MRSTFMIHVIGTWDYPHTIAPCSAWELDSRVHSKLWQEWTSTAAPATTC